MKIAILSYPQRSHINATLPVARAFKQRGIQVTYVVQSGFEAYVENQGFECHVNNHDCYSSAEERSRVLGFGIFRVMGNWIRKRQPKSMRRYRKQEATRCSLEGLVKELKFDFLLIDRAYSIYALRLWCLGIPFAIYVSMGNLSRSTHCPPLDSSYIPDNSWKDNLVATYTWNQYFLKRRIFDFFSFRLEFDRRFAQLVAQSKAMPGDCLSYDRFYHVGIRAVPELILSPQEFDFPRALGSNQFYVGSLADRVREEDQMDYRFKRQFQVLVDARKQGIPLVYCSFGTAPWRYSGLESFLGSLLKMAEKRNWNILLALGTESNRLDSRKTPPNVKVFSVVPQMKVLSKTDAMITHGGTNSICECILAKVPMLVLPGNRNLDQPGNAARVAYHGIGLKGNLGRISPASLEKKMENLLMNDIFKDQLAKLKGQILKADAERDIASIIVNAIMNDTQQRKYREISPI